MRHTIRGECSNPNRRFHYRVIAADRALEAADLLPQGSQAYAAALCWATRFAFDSDDAGRARSIYRRYVATGPLQPGQNASAASVPTRLRRGARLLAQATRALGAAAHRPCRRGRARHRPAARRISLHDPASSSKFVNVLIGFAKRTTMNETDSMACLLERGSPEPLLLRLATSHERLWRAALMGVNFADILCHPITSP